MSVSQLTRMVKGAIAQHLPATVRVLGQISNFKRHLSGHLYFSLKDEHSELGCVMWRAVAEKLAFGPADGLEVIASGNVDVFERSGRYQLHVRRLEPKGVGALELAFRQLREKLQREGLFDPARKKSLPRYPQRVVVVTSPTGAAVRDILQTLRRRWPVAEVCVFPVRVQGPTARDEVAGAIRAIDRGAASLGGVDVMIVGRGGGSLEDLWAFNEEVVARAIFDSRIPVVSAVGHEVDVTIADLVADVRAATPTAAAELVGPDRVELLAGVGELSRRLGRTVEHRLAMAGSTLNGVCQRRSMREPLAIVRTREQVVDELGMRLTRAMTDRVHALARRVQSFERSLQRIRPDAFAARMERRVSEAVHRLEQAVGRKWHGADRAAFGMAGRLREASPVYRLERVKDLVSSIEKRLESTSYTNTLRRGFSITRVKMGRSVVREAGVVKDGDVLITETADGDFESRVINKRQKELFD